MSVSSLVQGRIFGEIQTRPTKNGAQVTFFKIKVANRNATEFWSIASFSDTVREELAGLSDGDAISVVGALSVELFDWRGEKRISLKLTADRALALKAKPPKPKAEKAARASTPEPRNRHEAAENSRAASARAEVEPPRAEKGADFDDSIPF
jgi:hypothetical protein